MRRLLLGIALLLTRLIAAPVEAPAAEAVCALPTTIFCEDWETGTVRTGTGGFWPDGGTGGQAAGILITSAPANVFAGSFALDTVWQPATSGPGWLTRWFNANGGYDTLPLTGYDHVFARYYFKLDNSMANCSPTCPKLFNLYGNRTDTPFSASGQAGICPNGTDFFMAGLALVPSPPTREFIFYDYYPSMPCSNPVGQNFGVNIQFTPVAFAALNTWICIETEVQLNTPGQTNGVQRVWLNDALQGEVLNMRWRDSTALNLNAFQLAFSGEVQQTAHLYVDNVVAATQRIGCNSIVMTPPTGLFLTIP